MATLNLVKSDQAYYSGKAQPQLLEFGSLPYLTISGRGAPAGDEFIAATQALYPLAYGIKKVYKQADSDFSVPSLEGLWWVTGDRPALETPRDEWCWKLLLRLPSFVSAATALTVRADVARAKKNPQIASVDFEQIDEGRCAQILHVGPYASEPETITRLFAFITAHHLTVAGLHHEIYLSDPRKADPNTMKTLIRYPVRPAS